MQPVMHFAELLVELYVLEEYFHQALLTMLATRTTSTFW